MCGHLSENVEKKKHRLALQDFLNVEYLQGLAFCWYRTLCVLCEIAIDGTIGSTEESIGALTPFALASIGECTGKVLATVRCSLTHSGSAQYSTADPGRAVQRTVQLFARHSSRQ